MTGKGLELTRCYQYLTAACPELVHYGRKWWVNYYLMLKPISIVQMYTVVTVNAFLGRLLVSSIDFSKAFDTVDHNILLKKNFIYMELDNGLKVTYRVECNM